MTERQARPCFVERVPATIVGVRDALPEAEAAEFMAVIESTNVTEFRHTFEYWYRRAVINRVPGLRERISAGHGRDAERTIPIEQVIPGFWEEYERRQADGQPAA